MVKCEMMITSSPLTIYPPRQFIGLGASMTWEFEKRLCLYVGNSQAVSLGETVDPNDSVIEEAYQK